MLPNRASILVGQGSLAGEQVLERKHTDVAEHGPQAQGKQVHADLAVEPATGGGPPPLRVHIVAYPAPEDHAEVEHVSGVLGQVVARVQAMGKQCG